MITQVFKREGYICFPTPRGLRFIRVPLPPKWDEYSTWDIMARAGYTFLIGYFEELEHWISETQPSYPEYVHGDLEPVNTQKQ